MISINTLIINSIKLPNNSENNNSNNIDPYFITGICDGDASFYFSIWNDRKKDKWKVQLGFTLVAGNNPANIRMLEQIKQFFGNIGVIQFNSFNNSINFTTKSLKDCIIIRDHFLAYPLLTYKVVYFKLWCLVIDLIINKAHLTEEGRLKIIALKAHSPKGLSDLLLSNFNGFVPVDLPNYKPELFLLNIHWLCGFINADGGFYLNIVKNNKVKLSELAKIKITITQNNKSLIVLERIKVFLGLGSIYKDSRSDASYLQIASLTQINKFIEVFKPARLLGAKALDYYDFNKGVDIINNKDHLIKEGLNALKIISAGMNSKRIDWF
jgi:hypothetical protein